MTLLGVFLLLLLLCAARVTKLLLLFLSLLSAGPPKHDGTYNRTNASEWLVITVMTCFCKNIGMIVVVDVVPARSQ
jgi:hypothetical protein